MLPRWFSRKKLTVTGSLTLTFVTTFCLTGCHDGPLYALKTINPYFTLNEWKEDRKWGVTDHERRQELLKLVNSIGNQSIERQQYWLAELNKIMEHDPSAEMRRLAVAAAGSVRESASLALIEAGLDDEDLKVRMEACRALGHRGGEDAARLLAATLGTETNEDIRNSAIAALGQFSDQIAVNALKSALRNRDPATRHLAMNSLRLATGQDHGNDPQQWIAALETSGSDDAIDTKIADQEITSTTPGRF